MAVVARAGTAKNRIGYVLALISRRQEGTIMTIYITRGNYSDRAF